MKRILIISELFYPQNAIGALRPTKIRDSLIKKGYVVDVITKSFSNQNEDSENGRIWRIDAIEEPMNKRSTVVVLPKNSRFVRELKRAKRTILSIKKGRRYCYHVMDFLEKENIAVSDYSAIITTFGPVSSVMIGLAVKRKFHDVNWVCDFRDPMVVEEASVFLKPLMALLQNKACRAADHIVAVSNGYIRRICKNKYWEKAHMIPNGYDLSDAMADAKRQKNDKLTLVYVGALYEGKRDITPIFRALYELNLNGDIDITKIKFAYAGADYENLLSQAERYDMQQILENHGKLSRDECLRMQYGSDLLVLSTWNERGEEGVFPGKFLEYMLIGRPILSVTSGDIPNGEVTSVMREGQFGVAYESACDKEDIMQLKRYIQTCYFEWSQQGSITFEPVQEVLDRYNYDHIIKQIEELINEK